MAELSTEESPIITVFANNIKFFPMMLDQYKNQEICITAFNYDQNFLKYIPTRFITMDMCMKSVTTDINNMYDIPNIVKTLELCNYTAHIRIELILQDNGIPLIHRRQWMYELLLKKQLFFICAIPEIYIPLGFFYSPSLQNLQITQQLNKTNGKNKWMNRSKSILLWRCVNSTLSRYKMHRKFNSEIRKELLIVAWSPNRVRDWCLDIDTQKRINISFLL